MAKLPPKEARDVAGSGEKLARAKGGQTLEEIYNEGKDPLYRWRRMGEVMENRDSASPLSAMRNSPLKPVDLKSLPPVTFEGHAEMDRTLRRLANDQPHWFPAGYQGVSVVDGGETLFAAVEDGQFYLSNSDALVPGYRPAEALRSALQKIKMGQSLSFHEEYAVETLWHEMVHERTGIRAARRVVGQEPLEEGVIQLAARSTYPRLLAVLGGGNPAHQAAILERGWAYPQVTRNLVEMTRRAGIAGEQIEQILVQQGQQWLEPLIGLLSVGLNTKRAGSLLRYANIKPLADFREKLDVQIRNAPLRSKGSS